MTALGSDVIEGETYYVLVIYADENGLVNSFLSEPIEASGLDNGLMTGSATVFIYEDFQYSARVQLSPLNRVRIDFTGIIPSGSTVNRFEIVIPDFPTIQGVNQNGTFTNSNTFQNVEILPYCVSQQNGSDLEISVYFRVPEIWANTVQEVLCNFILNGSSEQEQQLKTIFEVEQFEDLKLVPDVIENISILDDYTSGESVFCENIFPNSAFADFAPFSRILEGITAVDSVAGSRVGTTAIEITNNTATSRHDLVFRLPSFSFDSGLFFSIYVNAGVSDSWTLQSRSTEGDFFVAYNGTNFVLNSSGGTTSIDIIERVDLGSGWSRNTFRTNTPLNYPTTSQFLIFYAGISTSISGVSFTPTSPQTFSLQLQVTQDPNYAIIDTNGASVPLQTCEPELNTCTNFDLAYIVATKKTGSSQQKHFVVHGTNASQDQEAESFEVTALPQITQVGIPFVDEIYNNNFALHIATQAQINAVSSISVISYPSLNNFRYPLHLTYPNGLKAAVQVLDNTIIFGGLNLFTDQDTDDFRFRISSTAGLDANNSDWNLSSDLTADDIAGLEIAQNDYIRVEYVGASTKTEIVGYLRALSSTAAIQNTDIDFYILTSTAANDVILWSGLNTNFTGVSSVGGTTNPSKISI